ncbi:MAG: GNAT family N-acetyltransferase [Alkaliphilus sp.]
MIEIKAALENQFLMIELFYEENQLNLKNEFITSANYVIVLEKKKILGVSKIAYENYKIPIIEMLFIIPKERKKGLGDGLLRATLNYLLKNGNELVLFKKYDDLNSFYLHENIEQFKKSMHDKIVDNCKNSLSKLQLENYYYCKPEAFFKRGCKS